MDNSDFLRLGNGFIAHYHLCQFVEPENLDNIGGNLVGCEFLNRQTGVFHQNTYQIIYLEALKYSNVLHNTKKDMLKNVN